MSTKYLGLLVTILLEFLEDWQVTNAAILNGMFFGFFYIQLSFISIKRKPTSWWGSFQFSLEIGLLT